MLTILRLDHWTRHAACSGHDPDLWTVTLGQPANTKNRVAKAICRTCPVGPQCRQDARDEEADGVIRDATAWTKGRPRDERRQANKAGRP